MAKAICTKRLINNFPFIAITEGEVVDYHVENRNFIVRDVALFSSAFFNHFKVTEGFDKMTYSDFEYILCNYVFDMAVLFPNEYDGVRHLAIQDAWKGTVMINVNKEENVIRVSFPDEQKLYTSYEDALDAIRNHKENANRPLTIEELIQMQDHAVWVQPKGDPAMGRWGVVEGASIVGDDKYLYLWEVPWPYLIDERHEAFTARQMK